MKTSLLTVFLSLFAVLAAADPVQLIFDTDITGDVDDVLALAMIHSLADRGKCELLAVTISKENNLAAPFVDAVNTFYGRPEIPIGISSNAPHRDSKYLELAEIREDGQLRYPHNIGIDSEPEDAVALLRKTLARAEDNSIALVQVGLATNIADLLDSKPDDISPLSGPDLIREKVDHLSVMAGSFETIDGDNRFLEANVRNHIGSMQKLAEGWPDEVPVIWSGFEIGIAVAFSRASVKSDFDYEPHHIVKEAYLLHSGPEHDRPCWDLTSVLYSVFPNRDYFGLSKPGRVAVEEDGFTRFKPTRRNGAQQGRDRYLTLSRPQLERVREALVQLVVQPPNPNLP